jgi:nonspecific dipeptidase
MLPLGTGCDGAHSQNEKMDVQNYIEGVSLLHTLLFQELFLKA